MSIESLLKELKEARERHAGISKTISNPGYVVIELYVFQEMLQWGINNKVTINGVGGQPGRPNGFFAHTIEYEGVGYYTETRNRLVLA